MYSVMFEGTYQHKNENQILFCVLSVCNDISWSLVFEFVASYLIQKQMYTCVLLIIMFLLYEMNSFFVFHVSRTVLGTDQYKHTERDARYYFVQRNLMSVVFQQETESTLIISIQSITVAILVIRSWCMYSLWV